MDELNAQQAAYSSGRNVRTILRHIADGSLRARKQHNGWRITLADLEARYGPYRKSAPMPAPAPRVVPVTSLADFPDRESAARWLMLHGLRSTATPKSWPEWRESELSQAAVLAMAVRHCDTTNHRITWRLHPCGLAGCVCGQAL